MRVKADTVQKLLMGSALVAALIWNLAQAAEVRSVGLAQGATGTRAEIELDAAADYQLISLAGPDRLVIDLPASSVRRGAATPAPSGIVRAVRYGQPSPGVARVVFDLAQPVAALQPRLEPTANGRRLVIEWPGDGEAAAGTAAAVPTLPVSAAAGSVTAVVGSGATAEAPVATRAAPPATVVPAPASAGASMSNPATILLAGTAPPPVAVSSGSGNAIPQPSAPSPVRAAPPAAIVATPSAPTRSAPAPSAERAAPLPPPVKSFRDASGKPLRPLVIAIDAGHGGQDPGALGPSGRREKDITLAIARELARQLNATPGYRAVLTRDADFFLPLNQRARLAKQHGADMFVSIHADAAENRAARGSSVYVLSLKGASSQRARWLADKENAADLIGGVKVEPGNTLASVLLDLTQSGNMRASEDAAGQVLAGLARLGPNHKRTVERANFAVLRTSDTPAMLVETAFISNPEEEQRLADPAQQRAIARAVLEGVSGYFTRQPPPGTLVAAQVEAQARQYAAAGSGTGGSP
ncbi:N-acetylmuramoyl-L-alanine amidase [Lysobacter humi (ex Lee et al. 2017)]